MWIDFNNSFTFGFVVCSTVY